MKKEMLAIPCLTRWSGERHLLAHHEKSQALLCLYSPAMTVIIIPDNLYTQGKVEPNNLYTFAQILFK